MQLIVMMNMDWQCYIDLDRRPTACKQYFVQDLRWTYLLDIKTSISNNGFPGSLELIDVLQRQAHISTYSNEKCRGLPLNYFPPGGISEQNIN